MKKILPMILFFLFLTNCQKKTNHSDGSSKKTAPDYSSTADTRSNITIVGSKQKWSDLDDPSEDGWETEVLADHANKQLKKLGDLFFNDGSLKKIITNDFSSHRLSPKNLETLLPKDRLLIQSGEIELNGKKGGSRHLEQELKSVRTRSTSSSSEERYVKFKIVGIEVSTDKQTFNTKALFSIKYKTEKKIVQKNAVWAINWKGLNEDTKILDISVNSFRQAIMQNQSPLFTEITESVIGSNSCYKTQLAYGMNHWLTRMPVRAMLNRFGTPGISIGDVNGDGHDDFFISMLEGNGNYNDEYVNGWSFSFPMYKGKGFWQEWGQQANNENTEDEVDGSSGATTGFWNVGDSVQLKWSSIDRNAWDFWYSLEFNNPAGPFGAPSDANSNINGGLGVFGGTSSQYIDLIAIPE